MKIEIRSIFGNLLFEYTKENNTVRDTVLEAIEQKADLSSADLRYANLRYADLSSADLRFADLRYANLRSADLSSADLRFADLSSADLSSANLRSADLSYANLRSADLSSANLRSADLSYANLSSAKKENSILPIYCKWGVNYSSDFKTIHIGCKSMSINDWDKWFKGSETFSTARNTEDFKLIEANYRAVKSYCQTMLK